MGNFNLIIQKPKPQNPINGVLCIDKNGDAQFFSGDCEVGSLVAEMKRVRIEHASSKGILLSGFETIGIKTIFQEWWLIYV